MGTKFYQCWYQIVPMLAPNFTNVGTKLYQYWHQIVPILASKCTNIGIKLYQYWHQIGSILASKCTNIGIKLYQYWLQMKTTFKLLCSGQLHFLFVFMLLRLHWSMHRFLYFYLFPLFLSFSGHFSNFSNLQKAVTDLCLFDPGGFSNLLSPTFSGDFSLFWWSGHNLEKCQNYNVQLHCKT